MRCVLSQVEYYLLALVQGFFVFLIAFAWVFWSIIKWTAFWTFEILIGCLLAVERHGICRSTVTLLRLLPLEFGIEINKGQDDAD